MDWFLYDNGLRHERVKLNFGAQTNLNMQKLMVRFTFFYFRPEMSFLGKFGKKN